MCKQAGVKVVYCAEQFDNDGTLLSSIVKNLKRVMAAEYSRELLVKVHAGKCRLAGLGFWQNAYPGFALAERVTGAEIARRLNREGILNQHGRPWNIKFIHRILRNENYIGNIVFNRTSRRLRQNAVKNPTHMWIRAEDHAQAS